MSLDGRDVVLQARALAQSHPLTTLAKRYVDAAADEQHQTQTLTEIGAWVSAALITGYCLRRVEENEVGLVLAAADGAPELEGISDEVDRIAGTVRGDGDAWPALGDADSDADRDRTIKALDRIIATEFARRTDNFRDQLDLEARAELEEYLTHWVVKGYALRAAELVTGALA